MESNKKNIFILKLLWIQIYTILYYSNDNNKIIITNVVKELYTSIFNSLVCYAINL